MDVLTTTEGHTDIYDDENIVNIIGVTEEITTSVTTENNVDNVESTRHLDPDLIVLLRLLSNQLQQTKLARENKLVNRGKGVRENRMVKQVAEGRAVSNLDLVWVSVGLGDGLVFPYTAGLMCSTKMCLMYSRNTAGIKESIMCY